MRIRRIRGLAKRDARGMIAPTVKRSSSRQVDARKRSPAAMLRSAVEETEPVLQIESTVTFIVLAVLFVPIGLAVLVVSVLLYVGLTSSIGQPTGIVATLIGLTWLGLTIGALFLTFRTLFRRLPGRVRGHAVPGLREGDRRVARSPAMSTEGLPEDVESPGSPSLAELDARLAPKAPPT
jgi:hypothetical protein